MYNGYRVFPGVKCGRGLRLSPHSLLVPWSKKRRTIPLLPYWPHGLYRASVPVQCSYTSTPPIGRTACTEPQCLYSTAIPLLPYWPHGLYRASVPESAAIPLLPLLAVRPVQSLSACTVAIPLLPLWTVRPVQNLSACTVQLYLYSTYGPYSLYRASVPVQYSYTSTPPMGRTACTEPHCLHNGAPFTLYFEHSSVWH